MATSVQETHLRRMLEGNRIRVGKVAWVPEKARLVGTHVSIDFRGQGEPRVTIELPESFDLADPTHRAWLWFNLEQALAHSRN